MKRAKPQKLPIIESLMRKEVAPSNEQLPRPMIMLPQVADLDLDVFETLPIELQREMAHAYLREKTDLPKRHEAVFRNVIRTEERSWIEANTEERKELKLFLDSVNADVMNECNVMEIRQYVRSHDPTEELEDVLKQLLETRCRFDLSGSWNVVKAMKGAVQEDSWRLLSDSLLAIVEHSINHL